MITITADNIVYYLPASIDEVCQLVSQVRKTNGEIRVRGAFHSVSQAITAVPPEGTQRECINVMLSYLDLVQIDKVNGTVAVQAGCHLGYDPYDPVKRSSWSNSLFCQLNAAGYAVPDMGGIIHQTVGGFLSTGSAGGSTTYSFSESLQSITFIPADSDNPEPVTVNITDANPDLFYAVGVSMGLLGIIVSATFNLVKYYCIQGTETITTIADCAIDMTGTGVTGKTTMRQFLLDTEYTRILWYPQPKVSKATVWQAKQIPYTDQNIKPYEEFPTLLGTNIPAQLAADLIYTAIGQWPYWLADVMGENSEDYLDVSKFITRHFYSFILPRLLDLFVPLDKMNALKQFQPQQFLDYWYSSLPMDNQVSDKIFPVEFTELWIPFADQGKDSVADVLRTLNQVFKKYYAQPLPPIPDGAFSTELYAAKSSKFWLSPAYGTDVFRVDVFWFGNNRNSPTEAFYPMFWEALQQYDFRCHWGKYMPAYNGAQGASYIRKQYAKWDDFMKFREQYDPQQVFVSDYWKKQLDIPAPGPT